MAIEQGLLFGLTWHTFYEHFMILFLYCMYCGIQVIVKCYNSVITRHGPISVKSSLTGLGWGGGVGGAGAWSQHEIAMLLLF